MQICNRWSYVMHKNEMVEQTIISIIGQKVKKWLKGHDVKQMWAINRSTLVLCQAIDRRRVILRESWICSPWCRVYPLAISRRRVATQSCGLLLINLGCRHKSTCLEQRDTEESPWYTVCRALRFLARKDTQGPLVALHVPHQRRPCNGPWRTNHACANKK